MESITTESIVLAGLFITLAGLMVTLVFTSMEEMIKEEADKFL